MLSTPRSTSRRGLIAPRPSPSLIAMQKQGLELTSRDQTFLLSTQTDSQEHKRSIPVVFSNATSLSPNPSELTRASSIYSTDSAHSSDSAETTISQILDMYTDLIGKLPSDVTIPAAEILQPVAYRDTVAPLLQRRFSTDRFSPVPLVSSQPVLQASKRISETSLTSSYKQAPGFQEFSRNLREKRAEVVSPLSASLSDYQKLSTLDSVSEPSPTTPRMRPFSWVGSTDDRRAVSPLLVVEQDKKSTLPPALRSLVQEAQSKPLKQPEAENGQLVFGETVRYIKLQDISGKQPPSQPSKKQELHHQEFQQAESDRNHRQKSQASNLTNNVVMHTGASETVMGLTKEKITGRTEAKEKASLVIAATQKYPAVLRDRRGPKVLSGEQRRPSSRNGVSAVIRSLSMTGSIDNNPTTQSRRKGKQVEIPMTPNQPYGAEIRTAKNKKKRREERQQERQARWSEEDQSQHRPKSHEVHQTWHGKTSSFRASDTANSQALQGKKNGLVAALAGARNSLMHNSAEKRRDKLKESIVVVGPTQLTLANACAGDGSLS